MDTNKLGIIILNYNTWNETVECVRSIQEYTSLPYTIYIVDNGSTDDSLRKLGSSIKIKNILLLWKQEPIEDILPEITLE